MQFWIISIAISRRVIGYFEGEGGGISKAKILKGKYEAKLEFQRGGGVQTKKTSVGGVLSFSEKQHITRPFEETKISTSVQRSKQITSFTQLLCWSSNDSTPQIEGIG